MSRPMHLWRALLCALAILLASAGVRAQKSVVPSRVVAAVDDTHTVTLKGNVHPLAKAANDQGPLPDSQPMTRMMLLLQRSPAQELVLRQLIDAQQTKGSTNYHAWMTPAQFGSQFGPSDADVQAVTDWLTREGFQVKNVATGKTAIEFDGTAGQVRNSFHTEIHKFLVNGQERFANVSDPAIPEALSPVVAGVVALHNFPKHSNIRKSGLYRRTKGSDGLQPMFTYGNPAHYALGPGDFAKIYNIPAGATGAGQSIAIIAQTNINTQDVVNFRAMFGLPAYSSVCTSALPPTCQFSVIINGPDPGILGPDSTDDEIESDLDTQWAGAVAPGANIYLIVSQSTESNPNQVSEGIDLSALYAVDNNIAPVISESYSTCEPLLLSAGNAFYSTLWEQAASQGITVAISTGDSGSASCDPSSDPNAATNGVAVNGIASTPFNVAVGGTDFDPSTTHANVATYWAPSTSGDVITSALGYMPEITWDNSACALAYPSPCTSVDTSSYAADISAGAGGPSSCILGTENSNTGVITCGTGSPSVNGGYAKPSWQSITPADGVRDLPDVSFFASNGGPLSGGTGVGYVICQSDANSEGAACSLSTPYEDFSVVGGTSAATPSFAAVMALVNQATGQRQGNANYVLYNLAAADTNYTGGNCLTSSASGPQAPNAACVFNDVNKGNNTVACEFGTPNCSNTTGSTSAYGVLICSTTSLSGGVKCPLVDNGTPAFVSGSQYDLATGLGSINVGNLLTKWTSAIRTATTTTLTTPSGGSPSGQPFNATITVAPTPTATNETVALMALNGTNVVGSFGPYSLTGGSATVTTSLLPPGTTSVQASYGGDATLSASTSAPVPLGGTVTGAGQTSTLTVYVVSFDSNGNPSTPTTSSQNFVYGSTNGYILKLVVTGSGGSCSFSYPSTKPAFPCPTGTIQLFDNGKPLTDFLSNGSATNTTSLNNQGFAEDQPINVNVGSHSITATYSGDKNYSAANSTNTLSLTLTQASTSTTVTSTPSAVASGGSVTLTAIVGTTSGGAGPTGTVTFTSSSGGTLGAPTCTPTAATSTTPAYCTATLTTSISAVYPPPTGKPGTPAIPRIPLLVALLSLLLFALGMRWIPQTRRRAYAYAGLLAIALLVGVVAGCGGGGGGGGGGGTVRTITGAYSGDTNYVKSTGTTTVSIQ